MKSRHRQRQKPEPFRFPGRRAFLLTALGAVAALLVWRSVWLQVVDREFLQQQGRAQFVREVTVPAHRGTITDRHGAPLALSTPVHSVGARPARLLARPEHIETLARVFGVPVESLRKRLQARRGRDFVYLRRQLPPEAIDRLAPVLADASAGVEVRREYRRYYPAGEAAGHVVGFTDIDDRGQEGVELAWDRLLRGEDGRNRVIVAPGNRVVEDLGVIRPMRPGADLALSIDRRLQYLAYRELKAAVARHRARAGWAVLLDPRSGEVLAMVNQPSYNPNDGAQRRGELTRNRAVTDPIEPGSTMKPFTVAAALMRGEYRPDTPVDTSPGILKVGGRTVKDVRNYGVLDVTGVITRSSNVGAARLALSLEPDALWSLYSAVGFGQIPGGGFPGEAPGVLRDFRGWSTFEQATMAFGYGISVTALQLARAYGALANDGVLVPVSFVRVETPPPGERVMPAEVARQVRAMLETVVTPAGTGRRARVPWYRVAGKTGTVRKAVRGGYADDRYRALFAGMAPASNPRLVLVVVIDEPAAGQYYGGQVAAPIFSAIMADALRLLDVPPDDLPELVGREGGREGAT